jgi:hypothetical protein
MLYNEAFARALELHDRLLADHDASVFARVFPDHYGPDAVKTTEACLIASKNAYTEHLLTHRETLGDSDFWRPEYAEIDEEIARQQGLNRPEVPEIPDAPTF